MLLKLHWAVSPGKVERVDVRGSNRKEEVAWIKANQAKYKGKWVVLLGNRVLSPYDHQIAMQINRHVRARSDICQQQDERVSGRDGCVWIPARAGETAEQESYVA